MMWLWTILGMFLVTYPVRLLPFLAPNLDDLPAPVKRGLRYVPPAALGVLIFPDSFAALDHVGAEGTWLSGTTGGVILAIAALAVAALGYKWKPGIIVPVLVSVLALVAALSLLNGGAL